MKARHIWALRKWPPWEFTVVVSGPQHNPRPHDYVLNADKGYTLHHLIVKSYKSDRGSEDFLQSNEWCQVHDGVEIWRIHKHNHFCWLFLWKIGLQLVKELLNVHALYLQYCRNTGTQENWVRNTVWLTPCSQEHIRLCLRTKTGKQKSNLWRIHYCTMTIQQTRYTENTIG